MTATRDDDNRTCPNCGIPLRSIVDETDGRCTDWEACDSRLAMLSYGRLLLLTPDGVTEVKQ